MLMDTVRNPEENSSSVYSVGTALAIDGLETFLKSNPRQMPDTLAFNLGTLTRNQISYFEGITPDVLIKKARTEIAAIAHDVGGMMKFAEVKNPVIYFYWHEYKSSVPDILLRPPSKARADVNKNLMHLLNSQMSLLDDIGSGTPNVFISTTPERQRRLPHKEIIRDILKMLGRRTVFMVSHYPLDFHAITKNAVNVKLLESYTGNISDRQRLNKKVMGHPKIPFCGILHQLLGDSEQLKSPLTRKETSLIKETAIEQNWALRPLSEIRSNVKDMGFGVYVKIDQ